MTLTPPSACPLPHDAALTLPPLHGFLAAPLRRAPDGLAIDVPPGRGRPQRQTMTYAELDRVAGQLAGQLAPRVAACSGEAVVALLIARNTPLLYAAQLAVLRAGAAFTCLDPAFPDARMADIIADAAPVALLADGAGAARLAGLGVPSVLEVGVLEVGALLAAPPPAAALPAAVAGDALAYIIYTSGTTGKPKGVLVEHRNIANLVASDLGEFGLGPGDRVAQGSSVAYDSSIEEIWLALASGATLVVMDDETARLGPDVVAWLAAERISVFCPPPTLLRATGCAAPDAALPDLRLLYVGGEALPRDLADLWARGRRMVNGYGPTECAVTCLRGDVRAGEAITIGAPVPGMAAYVLGEDMAPLADGEQGELCMGGAGVARGYHQRPDLTAEKFIDHPQLGRLYRTGDLVHRDGAGQFHYHGRIDAQVKIRGYRVELGEIEARLAGLPGVRAAGCRVQGGGLLAGFVVPSDPARPPAAEELRAALAADLPAYMVPAAIGVLEALPTTMGGKLDRARLPELAAAAGAHVAAEGALEPWLAEAAAQVLRRAEPVSVAADFFLELGGDSLSAALLVSVLRGDPRSDWVTVSDIYEARTLRALAARAHALVEPGAADGAPQLAREGTPSPWRAHLVQIPWLAGEVAVAGWLAWLMAFRLLPAAYGAFGAAGLVLGAPLIGMAGFALYVPASVALAVAMKRLLIGRYRPMRAAVWGGFYLRHWLVVAACRLIPWPLLQGSGAQITILRLLGARIGEGVHIHRGVDLARGGWDLLEIGDHAAIGQDAMIGLADLDRGDVVFGPVSIGAGASLATRAAIGGWCRMGEGAELTALSVLNAGAVVPAGERWDGVPARAVGLAEPVAPAAGAMPRWLWDQCAMLGEAGLGLLAALPAQALALAGARALGVGTAELWRWAAHPVLASRAGLLVAAVAVLSLPLTLIWTALLMRAMGPVRPGLYPRWGLAYLRAWLKAAMVTLAGQWLTGTIFWPRWLRLAGMRVGPLCEISTITDVVPELVTIGAETFFADGIYLGGGAVRGGMVRLGHTRLGRGTFLGNHVVIAPGEQLPENILVGIATPARASEITAGEARFGHPSFTLPRREVVAVDRSLTFEPGALRYANRALWEVARFGLPLLPLAAWAWWYAVLAGAAPAPLAGAAPAPLAGAVPARALWLAPLATLAVLAAQCAAVLVLKWALIGRVKPGQHALWSCWCSRWDYVYVAWARYATRILRRLDGTFLLPVYLRAMGLKIGRRAVLGPLFAQVVDPDMIEVGEGATVSAIYQAHTFEDRVLKVDKVRIGAGATVARGAVPLYGAQVGEGAHVGAGSVIMKHERLLAGLRYQGVPTRVVGREEG